MPALESRRAPTGGSGRHAVADMRGATSPTRDDAPESTNHLCLDLDFGSRDDFSDGPVHYPLSNGHCAWSILPVGEANGNY